MEPQTSRVPWTAKDIIRNKATGKLYLVFKVWIDQCTELIDLACRENITQPVILLPRGYDEYALDKDFITKGEDLSYQPITL